MSVSRIPRAPVRGDGSVGLAVLLAACAGALVALSRPGTVGPGLTAMGGLLWGAVLLGSAARVTAISASLAFVATLSWAYTTEFSPLYSYQGMVDAAPAQNSVLIVAVLAALPATWLPLSADRPSSIVLWFLYVLGYVPALVIPLFLTGSLERVLPFHLALLGSMAAMSLIVRLPRLPPVPVQLPLRTYQSVLVGLGALTSLYVIATFGLQSLPSLSDVYTTRAEFDTALEGAFAAGYIVPWAANAINPFLMGLGIVRRRWGLVALGLVGQLLIYSVTGFKSVLFSLLLVPMVYFAVSVGRRRFGLLAIVSAPVIVAGSVLASAITGEWSLALARRVFATPGQVGWYYFDYFSVHEPYWLSHSFLRWFVSSSYIDDPPIVIGQVYFPSSTPSANAHLWADAYANFGSLGAIVIFSVIVGFVLWAIDGIGRGRDIRLAGPMLAIAGMSLGSSALFTTLLTLGLGLGCVLMALSPTVPDGSDAAERPPP